MSVEPLPCPFCGGTKSELRPMTITPGQTLVFVQIECQSCGALGPTTTGINQERATQHWNNRKEAAK